MNVSDFLSGVATLAACPRAVNTEVIKEKMTIHLARLTGDEWTVRVLDPGAAFKAVRSVVAATFDRRSGHWSAFARARHRNAVWAFDTLREAAGVTTPSLPGETDPFARALELWLTQRWSRSWRPAGRDITTGVLNARWFGRRELRLATMAIWRLSARATNEHAIAALADTWGPVLDAAQAGLFTYWTPADQTAICVPWPKVEAHELPLHRATGPVLSWERGRHFFWRGTEVPRWVVMRPGLITDRKIARQKDAAVRKAMRESRAAFDATPRPAKGRRCQST